LWKKKYDFKRSKIINEAVNKYVNSKLNFKYNKNRGIVQKNVINKTEGEEEVDEEEKKEGDKKVGSLTDEDLIKLRDCEKKKIDWKNKLYLAPLTTVGNLPFRRICKEFGVDITCCEMAMSTNLLNGQASEWALLKRHESEDLFGIQLEGAYADTLTKACQIIKDNNFNIDFVDINCGCPIDLVFNKGAGCALMTRLDQFEKIIRSLDILMDCPITAKIRTGIKDDLLVGHEIVPQLKTWGVSMITLHGRTKNQRYSKLADWSYIDKCAQLSDPIPFFGLYFYFRV
jgi:tRNA-dihydrouridine synthase 3